MFFNGELESIIVKHVALHMKQGLQKAMAMNMYLHMTYFASKVPVIELMKRQM